MSTIPSIPNEDMAAMQRADDDIGRLRYYWGHKQKPSLRHLMKETSTTRKLLRLWDRLTEQNDVLFKQKVENGTTVYQLLLPSALRQKVLQALHDEAGHQGVERTTKLAQTRCYWPGMFTDIESHCKNCQRCTLAKAGRKLHPTMGSLIAKKPLEVLAMDFTVLEPGTNNIENVLVLTDVFTKFTQAVPCRDQKARTVARVLVRDWFVAMVCPNGCTVTRDGVSRVKSFKNFVRCTGFLSHEPHPTTQKVMGSVKDLIAPCMIDFAHFPRTRSDDGQNTYQS